MVRGNKRKALEYSLFRGWCCSRWIKVRAATANIHLVSASWLFHFDPAPCFCCTLCSPSGTGWLFDPGHLWSLSCMFTSYFLSCRYCFNFSESPAEAALWSFLEHFLCRLNPTPLGRSDAGLLDSSFLLQNQKSFSMAVRCCLPSSSRTKMLQMLAWPLSAGPKPNKNEQMCQESLSLELQALVTWQHLCSLTTVIVPAFQRPWWDHPLGPCPYSHIQSSYLIVSQWVETCQFSSHSPVSFLSWWPSFLKLWEPFRREIYKLSSYLPYRKHFFAIFLSNS